MQILSSLVFFSRYFTKMSKFQSEKSILKKNKLQKWKIWCFFYQNQKDF